MQIDSLAAGGKVSKAQYRAAMSSALSGASAPRLSGSDPTIAFTDATHATARRDLRITDSRGSNNYRLEYRLEKRDGRWLIVESGYLR